MCLVFVGCVCVFVFVLSLHILDQVHDPSELVSPTLPCVLTYEQPPTAVFLAAFAATTAASSAFLSCGSRMARQTAKTFSNLLDGIQYKALQEAYGMKVYASKTIERAF